MENGSLSNVIKKFGPFAEPLTAIYITQILKGLNYLHNQGKNFLFFFNISFFP